MAERNHTEVTVTDVRMPFFSMVIFMVKWAIAAIPALFILGTLFALGNYLLETLFRSGLGV